MKMSDKTYNVLKWIAQIVIPALGTFYFAIANIWSLPYAEPVVGTLTAVDTLLGALLGISTQEYKKSDMDGKLVVNLGAEDDTVDKYFFEVGDLDALHSKDTITLKVEKRV